MRRSARARPDPSPIRRRSRSLAACPIRLPGNNAATDTDTIALVADLAITKTDGVASVDAGGATTYSIVVSNAGSIGGAKQRGIHAIPAVAQSERLEPKLRRREQRRRLPDRGQYDDRADAGIRHRHSDASGRGQRHLHRERQRWRRRHRGRLSTRRMSPRRPAPPIPMRPTIRRATATPSRFVADLAITKTDGVASATPGGSTTYTIVGAQQRGRAMLFGATVSRCPPRRGDRGNVHCRRQRRCRGVFGQRQRQHQRYDRSAGERHGDLHAHRRHFVGRNRKPGQYSNDYAATWRDRYQDGNDSATDTDTLTPN